MNVAASLPETHFSCPFPLCHVRMGHGTKMILIVDYYVAIVIMLSAIMLSVAFHFLYAECHYV
jgi:hypothetical protein